MLLPTSNISLYTPLELPSIDDDNPNKNLFKEKKPSHASRIKNKLSSALALFLRIKNTLNLTIVPLINFVIFNISFVGMLSTNGQLLLASTGVSYAAYSWKQYPVVDIINTNGTVCPSGYQSVGITVQGFKLTKWRNTTICLQFGNSSGLSIPTLPSSERTELRSCTEKKCAFSCISEGAKCPVIGTFMSQKDNGTVGFSSTSLYNLTGSNLLTINITFNNTNPFDFDEREKRAFDLDSMPAASFYSDNGYYPSFYNVSTYYLRAYFEIPWMVSPNCTYERDSMMVTVPAVSNFLGFGSLVISLTIISSFASCCLPCILITSGKCETIWCPERFKAHVKTNRRRMANLVATDQVRMNEFVGYMMKVQNNLLEHYQKYVVANPKKKVKQGKLKLKSLPRFPRTIMKDQSESFCNRINRLRNSNILCLSLCGSTCNNIFSVAVFSLMIASVVVAVGIVAYFRVLSEENCSDDTMNRIIKDIAEKMAEQTGGRNIASIVLKGIMCLVGVIGIILSTKTMIQSIVAWFYYRKNQSTHAEYMAELIYLNQVITLLKKDYGFKELQNVC